MTVPRSTNGRTAKFWKAEELKIRLGDEGVDTHDDHGHADTPARCKTDHADGAKVRPVIRVPVEELVERTGRVAEDALRDQQHAAGGQRGATCQIGVVGEP